MAIILIEVGQLEQNMNGPTKYLLLLEFINYSIIELISIKIRR